MRVVTREVWVAGHARQAHKSAVQRGATKKIDRESGRDGAQASDGRGRAGKTVATVRGGHNRVKAHTGVVSMRLSNVQQKNGVLPLTRTDLALRSHERWRVPKVLACAAGRDQETANLRESDRITDSST